MANLLGALGGLGTGYFQGQDNALARQKIALQLKQMQDEQAQTELDRKYREQNLQALQPPPPVQPPPQAQPPAPGQSSMPARPQMPQQMPSPLMFGGGQQPQMGPQLPMGAPGGQKPPIPPWMPPQAPSPMQQQAPQGMPPAPQGAAQQQNGWSLPAFFAKAKTNGVPPEQAYRFAINNLGLFNAESRMQLAAEKLQMQQQQLEVKQREFEQKEARLRGQFGLDENGQPTMALGTRSAVNAGTAALDAAKINKLTKQLSFGGEGGAKGASTAGTGLEQEALDVAAWRHINTGQLSYRKGKGGPNDPNTAVMNRASEIGKSLGMTPEQLAAAPAEFKADAQSLYFQTKKVDAIEGVLNSFHNNMQTWDQLARGIAPTIGGAQAQALAGKLQAIDFTGIKTLDEVKLKIQSEFNNPSVAAYLVGAMAVATDFARIQMGPQSAAMLTEGARREAIRLISAGMNNQARAAVLGALDSDATGQVKGQRDQLDVTKQRLSQRGEGGQSRSAATPMTFKTEAEAKAAAKAGTLKPGTKITIGGVSGTWQ